MDEQEQAKLEFKKKVIDEQMVKFWQFVEECEKRHHQRDEWERDSDSFNYSNDGKVIAESVRLFSSQFLTSLTALVATL